MTGHTSVITNIGYNAIGNITSKSGVGTYAYHASKPHAVKSVRGSINNDYTYDDAGNIVKDNIRTFVNNTFNKPTTISKSGYTVDYAYGVGGKRYKRTETNYFDSSSLVPIVSDITIFIAQPKTTMYVGNVEFVKIPNSNTWQVKRYIGSSILLEHAGTLTSSNGIKGISTSTARDTRYLLTDHLGSMHVIANTSGQKLEEMSFDVFGAKRDANTWAREHDKISTRKSLFTLKGYTGHEQIDELSLVHMGGRIYDPILGRFLQADPAIQQPNNIQSFNRYSYVMNNPLNKTDPSGYIWVTLVTYALNYIASAYAATAIGTAISYALVAYQYYGYYQLAKGVLTAIEGGGTAMANFAGGFAKSYIKGQLEGLVINGISLLSSSNEAVKQQGGVETEAENADMAAESDPTSENNYSMKVQQVSNPQDSELTYGKLLDAFGEKITEVESKLNDIVESVDKNSDAFNKGAVDGASSVPRGIKRLYVAAADWAGANGELKRRQFELRTQVFDMVVNEVIHNPNVRSKTLSLISDNTDFVISIVRSLPESNKTYVAGFFTGRIAALSKLVPQAKAGVLLGDIYHGITRSGDGIARIPERVALGDLISEF